jgi:hypothetical protein
MIRYHSYQRINVLADLAALAVSCLHASTVAYLGIQLPTELAVNVFDKVGKVLM